MIVVWPGWIRPDCSAASIMRSAIRSLTEPPAEKNSHFARRVHSNASSREILVSWIRGVWPTCGSTFGETPNAGCGWVGLPKPVFDGRISVGDILY